MAKSDQTYDRGQRPPQHGDEEHVREIADEELSHLGDDLVMPPAKEEVDKSRPHGPTPQH